MQTVERPRLRQDLVAEVIEEGGQKFIDVGDPDNGNMFRLYEIEFSIACAMDGERDVAGIVQWAKDELGLMPSIHEVRDVIATLGQHGFLDQAPAARAAATERPAPAAARDAELAAGVVVGQQPQARPAAKVELELGSAGSTPAPAQPLPKAADIDLGAPGVAEAAAAAKPPRAPVEDVALGAPGARSQPAAAKAPEVSVDLADHMGVRPDDVKEAVRQSKQMSAVEVPKDLLEQVEAPVPPPRAATPPPVQQPERVAAKAEPKVVEKAAAARPVEPPVEKGADKRAPQKAPDKAAQQAAQIEKPADKKPADKAAEKTADKKPADKAADKKPADKPVVAEKQPVKPPAPRQGVSPVLIVLLVLAIGGAGAYFAWRYLIRGKSDTTAQVQPPPVTPGSGSAVVAPPPAPPAPKGKIEIVPGAERDILSVFPGTIESIDPKTEVDTSDVIAKLAGAKRLEAEIAAMDKEIEKRKATLDAAEAALEKLNTPAEGAKPPTEGQIKAADAAVDKARTALEDKQNERGTKEESLEKLYVRAPFEGTVTILAKQGQKIEENISIAKIIPKAAPAVRFTLEKNMTMDRGIAVPIKVGEKLYTCEVSDSNVDGTTVVCRTNNEGLTEGAEATLMVDQQ